MKRRGFTLIELLVVIVIIGILVAIALPNFIKIKDKAKEAEVKQNLHAIQLAVERYATDSEGNYPYYLYGGDSLYNIGTINYFFPSRVNGSIGWTNPIVPPFDMFFIDTRTWDYHGSPNNTPSWTNGSAGFTNPDALEAGFGDTLSFEGYLPKYPKNPFQQGNNSRRFGLEAMGTNCQGMACYGGKEGKLMFNVGWWGEIPQIMAFTSGSTASTARSELTQQNQLPGNFYYHPRWSDGVTNRGHWKYQAPYNPGAALPGSPHQPPLDDFSDVHSLDVAGYDLFALGSNRTKGQDYDNVILYPGTPDHAWRTGYPTLGQEKNPWIREGDYNGTTHDYDERPYSDGFPDFFIIHLGAGMDKKVGHPEGD